MNAESYTVPASDDIGTKTRSSWGETTFMEGNGKHTDELTVKVCDPKAGAQKENQSGWTLHHTLLLSGLCFIKFCSYTSVFIYSSFYPTEATAHGANGMEIGSTVGILQGVFLMTAYTLFHYTHIISPKMQVVLGGMTIGVSTIAFGFIDRMPSTQGFVALGFVIQIVHGIGIAASDLGIFIITNTSTPKEYVGTAVGFLEFSLAVALSVAPIIGGYLYEWRGFYVSFIVAGVLVLVANFIGIFLIPSKRCISMTEPMAELPLRWASLKSPAIRTFRQTPVADVTQGVERLHGNVKEEIEKKSAWDILKNTTSFEMVIYIAHFMMGGGFTTFFAGMIEPHLEQFHLTPGVKGLIISVSNAVSGITFPIWGWLADTKVKPAYLTIVGALFVISGFVLFGPFPYLPLQSTVTIMALSLCLCGCGISGILIAGYTEAKAYLMKRTKDEEMADTIISATYPSTYCIGSFIGAILGGLMLQFQDYRTGSAVLVGIQALGIILQVLVMIKTKRNE